MILTIFGTSSEQVDNVEMRTKVAHDLQFWHESLSLTPPSSGCTKKGIVDEMRTVEVRAGHTVIAKLLNDLWSAAWIGLAVKLKLSGPQLCLRLQGYDPAVKIFLTAMQGSLVVHVNHAHGLVLRFYAYISAFSLPPLCWTGSAWDRMRLPRPPCQTLLIQECDLRDKEKLREVEPERRAH